MKCASNDEKGKIPQYDSFPSHDGLSRVDFCVWLPDSIEDIQGIVQIVHGMSEYKERYDKFARFLTNYGYVVCAHDHIGHGNTARSEDVLGCFETPLGHEVLLEDTYELTKIIKLRYAHNEDIPFILFGHSMGSFIVRNYVARYPNACDQLIVSGTAHQAFYISALGNFVSRAVSKCKGPHYKSPLLNSLGIGSFSKAIKNPRTEFDWLSTNQEVVDAYINDPYCGFAFSAQSYQALTALTKEMVLPATFESANKNLKILFVSGGQDPVGKQGADVKQAARMYKKQGIDCRVIIYPNMRHEILNENGSDKVMKDIIDWIQSSRRNESKYEGEA